MAQTLQIQLLIYQHLSGNSIVSSISPFSIVTMSLGNCRTYKRISNKFNAIIRYYTCLFKCWHCFCFRCSNGALRFCAVFPALSAFEMIMALRYASSPSFIHKFDLHGFDGILVVWFQLKFASHYRQRCNNKMIQQFRFRQF